MVSFIFKVISIALITIVLFNFVCKLFDGYNPLIDGIYKILSSIYRFVLKLKNKIYEYFRQFLREKDNKVNGNGGTVQDDREHYDSSSEWED